MTRQERITVWSTFKNFSAGEFAHGDTTLDQALDEMDLRFVRMLDVARDLADTPFIITSGYREGDPNAHGMGVAADIRCRTSAERIKIVNAALRVGFTRIGVYDKHVHVDCWDKIDDTAPSNVMWWGVSKGGDAS